MLISNFNIPLFIKKNKIKKKIKKTKYKKNIKKIDKILIKQKKNVKSFKINNIFHQKINDKIMLKKIKSGINSNLVFINIYNSTRYIFSNNTFDLPKILKTLNIKKKNKKKIVKIYKNIKKNKK